MGSVANDTRDVMTVKRAKILVVDDDEDIISFLKITLEAEGHIVHTALSAEEGLESVNQDCPDLILLDLMMPDKDGGWFFDEFKSRHPNLINTPICFLTAKSDREDIIKGIRQGVDAYLTKPIDPELLLATINARLKHAEEIRNPPAAGKTSPLTVVVAALLTAIAFILDLIAPLGIAGGMPYVLLVLSGWWFRDKSSVLYLATIGSVLTFLGYYISPLGSSGEVVLTNRAYAIVIIWAVAFFIWWTWRNRHPDSDPSIAAHKPGQLGTSLFTKESIFVSVLAILIALSSWEILSRIQEGTQRDVAKSLRTALESSHLSIRHHMDDQKKTAIVWASNKLIQREIADLISLPTNAEVLINSRAQKNLRESMTPVFSNLGYRGFFVISNNNINLASTRDGNIGVVNLLSTQGDYLERVRAGETLISLPQHSDVPLTDVSGEIVEKLATMFVATPIRNDAGNTIAILAFRLDPDKIFSAIFDLGRFGDSGETYAFDANGLLISESRFNDHLRQIGLIAGNHSAQNVEIRNPGVNMTLGQQSSLPRNQQPLTHMAQSATAGEEGVNLVGYNDYRGVPVVGSWLWDKELGFGMATEVDVEEAYASYFNMRFTIVALGALIIGILILSAIFSIRYRRQIFLSEEKYRNSIDSTTEGYWRVDTNGRILEVNNAFCKMVGRQPDEIIGQLSTDFSADESKDLHLQKTSQISTTDHRQYEISFDDNHGGIVRASINATTVRNENGDATGAFAFFTDITDRKAAEKKLAEKAEELDFQKYALDEHAIVSIADVNGNITYANGKFCEISGYSLDELIGKNHRILKSDEHTPEFFADLWKTIANGKVWNGNIKNAKKDGGFYWVDATIVPFLDDQDRPFQYIAIRTDITDQKEAEEVIRDAEEQNRLLLTSVGDGIYGLDAHGLTTFVNPAVCKMLGYLEEELIGQSMHSLIHHSYPDGSIYPREDCHMYAALKDGMVHNIDSEVLWRKDGSSFPVEYTSTPILRNNILVGAVVTFRDITDRKESETLLKREEMESRLLHQVLIEVPEAETFEDALHKSLAMICDIGNWSIGHAYVVDDDMEDRLVPTGIWYGSASSDSQSFKEVTERTSFSLGIGLPGRVLKSGKAEWIVDIHEDANFPRAANADVRHLHGAFAFPIIVANRCIAVLEFFQERRVAEDMNFLGLMTIVGVQIGQVLERKKAIEEVHIAKENADIANKAKSEFLSAMSHELRTPMNAILGFGQMLEYNPKEPLSESQKDSVDHILKGGQHLLDLINEVLDLAKIEAGKMEMSIENISAKTVLDECLSLISTMAEERGIEIVVEESCNTSAIVRTDHTRFRQALLNLLSNAVKYNCENGKITVDSYETAHGMLHITVADTGEGIPNDRLDELFQPFSRLGAENSEIEGTGIGLTITKQIVESMDGHIGVDSEVGKGSAFWIELPLSEKKLIDAEATQVQQVTGGTKQLQSVDGTLLYVEDNPANLKLMEMIVEHIEGLSMISSHNAEMGIELAKNKQPDMIIMDINLPGMDGFAALKVLQGTQKTKDIPIIALSANAMSKDIEKGIAAGFKKYLTKPIQIQEVADAIKDIIEG